MKTQVLIPFSPYHLAMEATIRSNKRNPSSFYNEKDFEYMLHETDNSNCRELISEQELPASAHINKKIIAAFTCLEEKNKHLLDSIHYAKRLQEAIMPCKKSMHNLLGENFVLHKPKDIVGGDFYFAEPIPTNDGKELASFAVVDCAGHGVPGAFMSMLSYGILKGALQVKNINTAGEILDHLNIGISQAFHTDTSRSKVRDGLDISLCVLDRKSKVLQFAGANSKGIVVKKNKMVIELSPNKQAIGYDEYSTLFNIQFIQLEEGDIIYLFSDGYKDQFGGVNGKKLGYKNFISKLTQVSDQPLSLQKTTLENFFTAWQGDLLQLDDVLLLGIKV